MTRRPRAHIQRVARVRTRRGRATRSGWRTRLPSQPQPLLVRSQTSSSYQVRPHQQPRGLALFAPVNRGSRTRRVCPYKRRPACIDNPFTERANAF